LGLEGKMLLTAFATASVGVATGSMALALAAAVAVGLALSLLHGYACVTHRGDQVVLGMAITMTAAGSERGAGHRLVCTGRADTTGARSVRLADWFSGGARRWRRCRCWARPCRWRCSATT
jgi:ABC-type uncharacterized transport system permease subunit